MKPCRLISVYILAFCMLSCIGRNGNKVNDAAITTSSPLKEVGDIEALATPQPGKTAMKLDSMGYVNIELTDPSIVVEMVYATPDNFVGETLYDDLTEAYLLPEAAQKLAGAQKALKRSHPGYSLIIYDAARPMSAQRKMREIAVKRGKQIYVSNPANGGGLHNYGAAVDISIIDGNGKPLPMGTPFDFLGPESNTDKEGELVRTGKITEQELENRLLLRKVMTDAGFRTIRSEWWHFNLCSRKEAIVKYPLIDF